MDVETDPNGNGEGRWDAGEPRLYAIPAPREVGNSLLCLCKKVWWIQDEFLHSLFTPICKDEASCLLSDPKMIHVLSNTLAGSNLLKATDNGGIVGVPQTMRYIQHQSSTNNNEVLSTPISDDTQITDQNRTGPDVCSEGVIPEPLSWQQENDEPIEPNHCDTDDKYCSKPIPVSCQVLPKIDSVFSLASNRSLPSDICEPSEIPSNINRDVSDRDDLPLIDQLNSVKQTETIICKESVQESTTKESMFPTKRAPISCLNGSLKIKLRWNKRWKIEKSSFIYDAPDDNQKQIEMKYLAMSNRKIVYLSNMTNEDIATLKPTCSADGSTCIVTMKRKVPWVSVHKLGIDYLRQIHGNKTNTTLN